MLFLLMMSQNLTTSMVAKLFPLKKFSNCFLPKDVEVIIAVGEPQLREKLYSKVKTENYNMATIISDTALVSPSAVIEEGCVILDRTIVSSKSHLMPNCFVNGSAIIGHDVVVGKSSMVCSFSLIAGHSKIGDTFL